MMTSSWCATTVATWHDIAKSFKLKPAQIERMESAFEHDDLKAALALTPTKAKPSANPPKKATKK